MTTCTTNASTAQDMHVPQGDSFPVHWTVKSQSGIPQTLGAGWYAIFTVAASAEGAAEFSYSSLAGTPKITIDDQSLTRGGISMRFQGSDIATPTPANTPKWYRLKIFHPDEAPDGLTVRFGPFYIDDV